MGTITSIITRATTTLPVTGGRSAGRNAVTAPSAKIQAFGLRSWNVAPPRTPSGRARAADWSAPERRDLPREVEQVRGSAEPHDKGELGHGRDNRGEPGGRYQRHRPDAERRPEDVRQRAPEAERCARRPEQDVVGPRREGAHEREADEGEKLHHRR